MDGVTPGLGGLRREGVHLRTTKDKSGWVLRKWPIREMVMPRDLGAGPPIRLPMKSWG